MTDTPGGGETGSSVVTGTTVGALRHWARETPTAMALAHGRRACSFAELVSRFDSVGGSLVRGGVGRGSRVAYIGRNSIEFFEVLLGVASIGAVIVPVNWRLAAPEVAAIIADAGAGLVFAEAEFVGLLPADVSVVVIGPCDADGPDRPDQQSYDGWCSDGPRTGNVTDPHGSDPLLQLYTSGTTGLPKGVVSGHDAVARSLRLLALVTGMRQGSVTLCTLPTFHIGGTSWTLAALTSGSGTVLLSDVAPDDILGAIESHHVSIMIAVPTIIQRLVEHPPTSTRDLGSLATIYYGGGPMTSAVIERALATLSCEFIQGFGLTEIPLISVLPPEAHLHPALLRSCGRVAPETEVRLIDPDSGRDVSTGSVGEIWVRSPRVMSGYWRKPDLTAEVLDGDGWFRTGDAASIDEDGYLYIRDRIKDMIITGGENVYPAEVENVLMAHPAVAEAA
ncbi:MAG: hypothetical protein JWP31_1140, partial [Aeromicrobium sp.]|nr:hypothetical protein [Aeromicrobium sp.]